jgi:hypothetical protein
MSTEPWLQRDISVASVVEAGSYAQLGIPHFQRGLVWGDEAVGLLLESLFHDTPCGTFILWKPLKPASHGVGLVTRHGNGLAYLIVDGQQRIRSLHGVFGGGSSEGGAEEPDEGDTVWCVNLVQVPRLEKVVDSDLDGYPLFMKVRPPDADKARFRHNIVPLAALLSANDREVDWERYIPQTHRRAVLDRIAAEQLPERCQEMLERRMVLVVKEETEQNNGLPAMVRLYNRINSSGKRVEAEERAFATLTAIWPATGAWVSEMFRKIHPDEEGNEPAEELDRDDVLARKKERSFGFKLFIRALVQVCSYHLDYSIGSSGFSFDVVARADFQQKLSDEWNKPDVAAMWDTTRECILKVRGTLEALGCDDLRMLPDTECLLPFFHVLIRYPRVLDDARYDRPLQAIALRMVLCEMSARERLVLVRLVNESDSFAACMKSLVKEAPVKVPALEVRLGESDSLQDRYVLLLYWLLRRRDASDFSARSIKDADARAGPGNFWARHGLKLRDVMKPEKQHMVPYSRLKGVYDLGGRTRLSAHIVNNIGNVTYISSALNGLSGLADEPVVLAFDPVKNLRAHFLLEDDQTKIESALGQRYASALDGHEKDFERFCEARCKLMAEAFEAWLSELDASRVPDAGVAPADRLLASRWPAVVRELKFSPGLEDRLVGLIREGADASDARGGGLVLELKDGGRLWVSRDEVTADGSALERHPELRRLAEHDLSDTTDHPDRSLTFSKPMNPERERAILDAMDEVVAVVRIESASGVDYVADA